MHEACDRLCNPLYRQVDELFETYPFGCGMCSKGQLTAFSTGRFRCRHADRGMISTPNLLERADEHMCLTSVDSRGNSNIIPAQPPLTGLANRTRAASDTRNTDRC